MQVQRRVSAEEALAGYIKLARASRMTGDEHEHFSLLAQVIKVELDEGAKAQQELETLKAEHAKCADKPSGTNPVSRSVGSEGNGAHVGEDRSPVGANEQVQELIQRPD